MSLPRSLDYLHCLNYILVLVGRMNNHWCPVIDLLLGVFDKNNGGGFLDELYPTAYVTTSYIFLLLVPNTQNCGMLSLTGLLIYELTSYAAELRLSGTLRAYIVPLAISRTLNFRASSILEY